MAKYDLPSSLNFVLSHTGIPGTGHKVRSVGLQRRLYEMYTIWGRIWKIWVRSRPGWTAYRRFKFEPTTDSNFSLIFNKNHQFQTIFSKIILNISSTVANMNLKTWHYIKVYALFTIFGRNSDAVSSGIVIIINQTYLNTVLFLIS